MSYTTIGLHFGVITLCIAVILMGKRITSLHRRLNMLENCFTQYLVLKQAEKLTDSIIKKGIEGRHARQEELNFHKEQKIH